MSSRETSIRPAGRSLNRVAGVLLVAVLATCGLPWLLGAEETTPTEEKKSMHPPIPLLDRDKVPVQESGGPVSTRTSCGGCHDYAFISDSLHTHQGRRMGGRGEEEGEGAEKEEKAPNPYENLPAQDSSRGMYGKWCSMPNRQVPRETVTDPADFDLGTPEWVRSCGTCHVGGGVSEFDRQGRRYDEVEMSTVPFMDMDYYYYSRSRDKPVAWDWKESGIVEMDCFLCHISNFDREARDEYLKEGWFGWANTASLLKTGIVVSDYGELVYNQEAFAPDGTVKESYLRLQEPTLANCAQCHGYASRGQGANEINPFFSHDLLRGTKKFGRVWTPDKIKDSNVNLVDKESLDFPWDIHAAKDLNCTDCHFSLNSPTNQIRKTEAEHLLYNPKTTEWEEYLRKPMHDLARGSPCPETVDPLKKNTMRRCDQCHDGSKTHGWLPFRDVHYRSVGCEVCHIPRKYYWSYSQVDLTIDPGGFNKARGVEGSFKDLSSRVTGFQPAYMPRVSADGEYRITAFNPITSVYWFDKERNRPLFKREVRDAFWTKNKKHKFVLRPEVVAILDQNGDGEVGPEEFQFRTEEQRLAAVEMLKKAGVEDPELLVEITPFSVHHNIVTGKQAIRNCTECHGSESRLMEPVEILDYTPAYDEAGLVSACLWASHPGDFVHRKDGKTYYESRVPLDPFYIVGTGQTPWVDTLGWITVLLSLAGALVHGTVRFISYKRRTRAEERPE